MSDKNSNFEINYFLKFLPKFESLMLSVYDLNKKTLIQFRSFPMHCKCETIKLSVALTLSKPWFLSLVFGHEHISKILRINFFFKNQFFRLWENASPISIYEKSLILDFLFNFCSDFRYENNGIFVLGWVFFLQTNFDFLTSHFWRIFFIWFESYCYLELKFEKIFHLWSFFVKLWGFEDCHFGQFGTINARSVSR